MRNKSGNALVGPVGIYTLTDLFTYRHVKTICGEKKIIKAEETIHALELNPKGTQPCHSNCPKFEE